MGRGRQGKDNSNWKGGRRKCSGYVYILSPDHPRADGGGYVPEHTLVCEKILGKYLPDGSIPHHVNGKRDDNRPENLVLCQDRDYHSLIHQRMRALKACGHANWRKCWICKRYDLPEKLVIFEEKHVVYHVSCWREYNRNRRKLAANGQ